ncbi:MAG: CDP-glycerol glycerophosphotransferase family protein, partial [Elusimicrobiota bacterium]|nr:CDP-glycerol glycerophosphotransferase family protein [Elusimicrobiota bacterium]
MKKNKKLIDFSKALFSLYNEGIYKIMRILGLKIRIRITRYRKKKIAPLKIVFNNLDGNGYGCNPKYIAQRILDLDLPFDIVWLVKDEISKDDFPKQIRLEDFNSIKAVYELATAKVIVSNLRI